MAPGSDIRSQEQCITGKIGVLKRSPVVLQQPSHPTCVENILFYERALEILLQSNCSISALESACYDINRPVMALTGFPLFQSC